MRQKLTKSAVEGTAKGSKRVFLWDAGDGSTKGFGLKVMPSGKKIFIFQYRMGGRGTPTQRYTIGPFGPGLTVEKARKIAEGLEREVSAGTDPSVRVHKDNEQKRDDKAAKRASQKGRVELVVEQYLRTLEKQDPPFRTAKERRRILEKELTGTEQKPGPWRGRVVTEITKDDVRALLGGLKRRGRVKSIRNLFVALNALFAYATEEFRASNPARGIKLKAFGYKAESRDRALSAEELRELWIAADKTAAPYGPFFKLLLLTGQRRSEVSGMRWSELTPGAVTPWKIPGARAKNASGHTVHLNAMAVSTLTGMTRTGPLIFAASSKKPISGFSKAVKQLSKDSGVKNWRLHDLRRTFATVAAEVIKVPPHVADKVLNHKTGAIKGVAAIYQRAEFLDERRAALDAWGIFVSTLAADSTPECVKNAAIIAAAHYRDAVDAISKQPPALRAVS
jgi:integrase